MYDFIKGFAFPENVSKCKTPFYNYFPEAFLALKVFKHFLCLLAFVLACFILLFFKSL